MWITFIGAVLLLSSPFPFVRTHQNQHADNRKSPQDLKVLLRSALQPIVNYVSSMEPPSQLELDLILEDLYDGITLRKVFYLTSRFTHFSLYQIYAKIYPYYNTYSIKIIKSLREFFDSHAGQTVYNPWTHLRRFKQGNSQSLEHFIVSVSIAILAFLLSKKQYLTSIIFLVYFIYVYAFKSITTLFYLYVTIFSPVFAVVAVLKEHTWIVVAALLPTYISYAVICRFFAGKCCKRPVKVKKVHDASNHSDVILARLNDLELRFNKICERLARLEKEQRRK